VAHYLFNLVTADASPGLTVREQAARFLRAGMWGVDADEPHRDALASGDLVLLYLGAPERKLIGRAELASAARDWSPSEAHAYPGEAAGGVLLARIEEWHPPVPMSAVLSRIDRSAGARADFETGVVRITAEEFEIALAVAARRDTSAVHEDLLAYRDRFPILADCTYLINHSLAAMPAAAEERLLEYARMWRERGIRSWGEGWWEMPVTIGDQLGRIMGAPPGSIVMHQNVTVAEAIVLSCFPQPGARNRIVYEEANFPSVRYLYQAQPQLEVVAVEDDRAIVDAIDERTLLVPISHVLFKNAEIQDVEPIVRRAHEAGAHVVLDCYQSAGVLPFDLTALDVDFAVGGSVKWLCGGPGAGWLYVRPDLAERLEPTLVGWQGHARPFAFEPDLEYADGARRFLTGTPNVPALYAASAGYDVIEEVGVERIRERSLALTRLLIDLCDEAGLEVVSPREPERRGGTVVVSTPDHAAVHRELTAREVICDFRPDSTPGRTSRAVADGAGGVRVGPHFFNSEDELRHALGELADIVATGAYERHAGAAARF
jgi:kynureninase